MPVKLHIYSRLTKYLLIVGLSVLAITIALGIILIQQSRSALLSSIQNHMLDIANTAASMLDGDTLERIKSGDPETKEYKETYTILKRFHDKIDLEYIYCIRDMGNRKFVFLLDPSEEDPGEFGSPVVTTEELARASKGEAAVNKEPYEDNWGSFYSAYSPVFTASGKVAAIVAVDFSSDWYEQQIAAHIRTLILTALIALGVIFALAIIITKISRSRYRTILHSLHQIKDEINQLLEVIEHLTYFQSPQNVITKVPDSIITTVYDIKGLRDLMASIQNAVQHKVEAVMDHAYVDGLTFLNNQAAYIKAIHEVDKKITDGTPFIIAVFDICGLKKINDSCGYETGNMAILDAANLLKSVFKPENIYRYTSGAFAGIFHNIPEDAVQSQFAALEEKIDLLNRTPNLYKVPLTIAKGYAVYTAGTDADSNATCKRAEQAMYNDKARYHTQSAATHDC